MQPERILVVDDDEDLLCVMVSYLQQNGYDVERAHDGDEALHLLQSFGPFAVLVADLILPGMSGLALLREARRLDPWLEVIVITAAGTLESAIAAMREEGAYDYLRKPLDSIHDLSLAVARAADHRRLRLGQETLQAMLIAKTEQLQALINNTGDAILSANAEGILTTVNPAAVRLLGHGDLVGSQAQLIMPPPLATLLATWQAVGGQYPALVEVPWPADSVQLISLTPLSSSNGDMAGWIMDSRDITHLKRQDELKMQLLRQAARKIQFPLARAIFNLAELREAAEAAGEYSAQAYSRLAKLWDCIQEWTDELLSLVQIEAGVGLRLTAVSVAAVVDEMRRSLADGRWCEKGLSLDVNLAPGLPPVYADPDLLRQMLQGLISRAASRSRAGSEVCLCAYEEQGQVWIEVSDDGPPVGQADLPHLFEKSFGRSNGDSGSAGLELAMAKAIADKMGGQVWVGGQGRVGSTIVVCLPTDPSAGAGHEWVGVTAWLGKSRPR